MSEGRFQYFTGLLVAYVVPMMAVWTNPAAWIAKFRGNGMSQRKTNNFIRTCALVGAFGVSLSAAQGPQPPTAVTSLTATVSGVDTEERMLKLITGVGHALQTVWIRVPAVSRITVAGTAGRLGDLKRGDVVRISYRRTPEGNVATSIETVQTPRNSEKR